MINLRRRFILEIHKLHLTNRMPDGIRDDEDEDEFDKYDPSTCPQEYIPIIQKLEKLEIQPDEYYLWYKKLSRALLFRVQADRRWCERTIKCARCSTTLASLASTTSRGNGRQNRSVAQSSRSCSLLLSTTSTNTSATNTLAFLNSSKNTTTSMRCREMKPATVGGPYEKQKRKI